MANQAVKIDGIWQAMRIAGWCLVGVLLILPAVAMRYTSEVDWSAGDFIVMGALFGTIGFGTEFLVRRSASTAYRIGAVVAMATAFLTVWVNLAVGMIGDGNPYNLLFGGVVLVALLGSVFVDFKAAGMARVMFATALLQAAVAAGGFTNDPRGAVFGLAFAMPWVLAGGLFRSAARSP